MRIVGLRAVPLSAAPGDPPLEWVGGRIETWDAALVEITTADGVTGVGEAAQGIMAAAALPGLVAALRPYAEGLEFGHPREVGDALRDRTAFWARGGIAAGAVAAVEVAAFDAMGKALGVPAYELLGGLRRDRVEVYASGGLGVDEDQVVAWARAMEADGFGTVKFRAMTGPDRTIGLVDKVLAALRPETRFVLDAVQGCAGRPWPHQDVLRSGGTWSATARAGTRSLAGPRTSPATPPSGPRWTSRCRGWRATRRGRSSSGWSRRTARTCSSPTSAWSAARSSSSGSRGWRARRAWPASRTSGRPA